MSIATAITAAQGKVANAYTAVSNKGGTLPATQNLSNLPTAISSIPSGGSATLITKTITQNGTYNASSDNADGYSSVTVNVSGGGGGYTELPSYQVVNGVASGRNQALTNSDFSNITTISDDGFHYSFYGCTGLTGNVVFNNLTTVGANGLYGAFKLCTGLTSVSFSALTSVGIYGFSQAFDSCTGLVGSLSFMNLTSVGSNGFNLAFNNCKNLSGGVWFSNLTSNGSYGFQQAFYNCEGISGVYFNNLTSTGSYGFYRAFYGCKNLSNVILTALTSVNASGLYQAFYGCVNLSSVKLTALTSIYSSGLYQAFYGCTGLTDVYFNALTTTSFGSYKNQFQNMLSSTGTTVIHMLHFPSNLTSIISGLSGYPFFGGTSGYVVCAFDLPATS